jgi:hypothetical protein
VPDVLHRFGEPLLRYIEFVSPVLNFVRLQKADAASVLRTFVREIIRHSVFSDLTFNAIVSGRVPFSILLADPLYLSSAVVTDFLLGGKPLYMSEG